MKLKKNIGLLLAALTIFTSCANDNTEKVEETKKEQAEEVETKKTSEENSGEAEKEENAEKTGLKDGTYTGSGTGHQGPLEVEVLIEDGKIKSLDITKTSESPGVKKALEILPYPLVEL